MCSDEVAPCSRSLSMQRPHLAQQHPPPVPSPPARPIPGPPTCTVCAGREARRAEFGSLPVGRPVQQVLGHLLPCSDRSPKTDEAPSPEEEQCEKRERGEEEERSRAGHHLLPALVLLLPDHNSAAPRVLHRPRREGGGDTPRGREGPNSDPLQGELHRCTGDPAHLQTPLIGSALQSLHPNTNPTGDPPTHQICAPHYRSPDTLQSVHPNTLPSTNHRCTPLSLTRNPSNQGTPITNHR